MSARSRRQKQALHPVASGRLEPQLVTGFAAVNCETNPVAGLSVYVKRTDVHNASRIHRRDGRRRAVGNAGPIRRREILIDGVFVRRGEVCAGRFGSKISQADNVSAGHDTGRGEGTVCGNTQATGCLRLARRQCRGNAGLLRNQFERQGGNRLAILVDDLTLEFAEAHQRETGLFGRMAAVEMDEGAGCRQRSRVAQGRRASDEVVGGAAARATGAAINVGSAYRLFFNVVPLRASRTEGLNGQYTMGATDSYD